MSTNESMGVRDRKTILVVEDDPAMRRVLVQALVAQGAKYRVMNPQRPRHSGKI